MLRTLWEGVRISNLEIKSDPVYNNLEYSLDSVKGLVLEVYNSDGYSSFNEVKNTPNEVYNFSHLTSGSKLSNSYSGDLEAYLPFISSNGTLTSTLAG
jgi:hypothetical protein